ncbi:MAG: MraY family glycosyltransferase [Thermoanaerobaculia bacterium]
MDPLLIVALAAALIAGTVASLLVPPVVRLAEILRSLDRPTETGERKSVQATAVPRLGGVAIASGLAAGGLVGLMAGWNEWGLIIPRPELVTLPIAAGLVFLVGLIDDLFGVSPAKKFLVQFIAAWLLVRVGWSFTELNLPFFGEIHLGVWGSVVSLLWVVGVTNAINLIDGLDGLAGGVAAIISASLLAYALLQHNQGSVILLAGMFGACIGFLRHNWQPARVFMGDSGSLTLGFLLGATALHSAMKAPAAVAILVPILALGLPIIDTLLVMVVRFVEGDGATLGRRISRMFRGDRQHLHHLLSDLATRHQRVVGWLYLIVVLFCGAALSVAVTGQGWLGLVLLIVEIAVVIAMRQLGLVRRVRALAAERVDDLRLSRPGWLRKDDEK